MYKFLYNITVMMDLSDIITSRAKYLVLRALFFQEQIPLRHIAYLSKLHVYSVQHALKKLLEDKVILKRKIQGKVYYETNMENQISELLSKIFELETKMKLARRAKLYKSKALSVLSFSNSAQKLFNEVRKD